MRINIPVTEAVENYLDRVAYREHPSLTACRMEASERGKMAVMQIAPEQGAFLQMLVRLLGVRRILELGTFTGYSTLAMALALPADGKVITCDNSTEYQAVAQRFWTKANVVDRIDVRTGNATQTLDRMLSQGEAAFDMVFIDADKPGYPTYYEKALALTKAGGLILLDDTLVRGRVVTGPLEGDGEHIPPAVDAIRELNTRIQSDQRVEMVLLPWRDGLTLVRKR